TRTLESGEAPDADGDVIDAAVVRLLLPLQRNDDAVEVFPGQRARRELAPVTGPLTLHDGNTLEERQAGIPLAATTFGRMRSGWALGLEHLDLHRSLRCGTGRCELLLELLIALLRLRFQKRAQLSNGILVRFVAALHRAIGRLHHGPRALFRALLVVSLDVPVHSGLLNRRCY